MQVISMGDTELTGEFLQCLRILGISRDTDRVVWPMIVRAISYLLDVESHYGSVGMFSSSSDGAYNRYHTTYCAIVGLLSFKLSEGDVDHAMVIPLIPHAFHVKGPR